MTKLSVRVIIRKQMRECWNGRQARLRCVWFRRVGSSPISRTKSLQIPCGFGEIFCARDGTRKGDTSPQTGVKSVRWTLFSPWESPSNSRRILYGCGLNLNIYETQKESPTWAFGFFNASDGTRKAVKKTCLCYV